MENVHVYSGDFGDSRISKEVYHAYFGHMKCKTTRSSKFRDAQEKLHVYCAAAQEHEWRMGRVLEVIT